MSRKRIYTTKSMYLQVYSSGILLPDRHNVANRICPQVILSEKVFQVCLCLVLLTVVLLFFTEVVQMLARTSLGLLIWLLTLSHICLWSASRAFLVNRSYPRFRLLSSPEFQLVVAPSIHKRSTSNIMVTNICFMLPFYFICR